MSQSSIVCREPEITRCSLDAGMGLVPTERQNQSSDSGKDSRGEFANLSIHIQWYLRFPQSGDVSSNVST